MVLSTATHFISRLFIVPHCASLSSLVLMSVSLSPQDDKLIAGAVKELHWVGNSTPQDLVWTTWLTSWQHGRFPDNINPVERPDAPELDRVSVVIAFAPYQSSR